MACRADWNREIDEGVVSRELPGICVFECEAEHIACTRKARLPLVFETELVGFCDLHGQYLGLPADAAHKTFCEHRATSRADDPARRSRREFFRGILRRDHAIGQHATFSSTEIADADFEKVCKAQVAVCEAFVWADGLGSVE